MTPLRPRPVELDRTAADLGSRLALWLADVSAEAALTPLRAPGPPDDPAHPDPICT